MRETYFLLNYEIQQGNTELLPEVIELVIWNNFGIFAVYVLSL